MIVAGLHITGQMAIWLRVLVADGLNHQVVWNPVRYVKYQPADCLQNSGFLLMLEADSGPPAPAAWGMEHGNQGLRHCLETDVRIVSLNIEYRAGKRTVMKFPFDIRYSLFDILRFQGFIHFCAAETILWRNSTISSVAFCW